MVDVILIEDVTLYIILKILTMIHCGSIFIDILYSVCQIQVEQLYTNNHFSVKPYKAIVDNTHNNYATPNKEITEGN